MKNSIDERIARELWESFNGKGGSDSIISGKYFLSGRCNNNVVKRSAQMIGKCIIENALLFLIIKLLKYLIS